MRPLPLYSGLVASVYKPYADMRSGSDMNSITVVIPVSPIVSHPDIGILTETVESVRHWLPDAEIKLTFDGVRDEQEDLRKAYEEATYAALQQAATAWHPVTPFVHRDHSHQSGMLRFALEEIRTPLMLYVESDTPLVTDKPIDWDALSTAILDGKSNLIRLYHEAVTPPGHEKMMHGKEPGTPLIRTQQWSQRPHLASVAYYRRILRAYFSPGSRAFIEDRMYGVLDEAYNVDGINGWMQHRVHIYAPKGGDMKRSLNLDGRAGQPKYDATQCF